MVFQQQQQQQQQILAYMAFCEVSQDQSPGTPAAAGDFGFKVLTSSNPAEKTNKLIVGGVGQRKACDDPDKPYLHLTEGAQVSACFSAWTVSAPGVRV